MQMNLCQTQFMTALENATDFTRVFVGRMANSSRYMIALDDNRLGYGVYQYYAYDRMYFKQDRNVNGNYFGSVSAKGISDGSPFFISQILDTDESNYTNSDKTYVVIDGTRYNYSSISTTNSPNESTGVDGDTSSVLIGGLYSSSSYYWSGDISEVMYFDYALDDVEQEAMANGSTENMDK